MTQVATIYQDTDGWHVCNAGDVMLDARGRAYETAEAAINSLRDVAGTHLETYTHYQLSGGDIVQIIPSGD